MDSITGILFIKNMVCDRCISAVRNIVAALGYSIEEIKLGEVKVKENVSIEQLKSLSNLLLAQGFELLDDRKEQLLDKIKTVVIESIYSGKGSSAHINFSHIIQERLGRDYQYLSSLFSTIEGITIEKYIILQKIEKAKELLNYDELTLSEISYQLNYSSVQHLSSQFKKVTGLTPSQYKLQKENDRKAIDKVGG